MKKTLFAVFGSLLIILCLCGCNGPEKCIKTNKDIRLYLSGEGLDDYGGAGIDAAAVDIMPELKSLPSYQKIEYQSAEYECAQTVFLVVEYDSNTYDAEKKKLDDQYKFLDHNIADDNDPTIMIIPQYEFSIDSYDFRAVTDEKTLYPHDFGIIGTSDDKRSIAYLYFTDASLDCISMPSVPMTMADFLKEYFRYPW